MRAAAAVLCVLCSAGAATAQPLAKAATVKVGKNANGTTVHPRVGDTVVLTLPDCLSCGFRWTVAPGKTILRPVSIVYRNPKLPPGMVGGVGTAVFRFAVKAGGGLVRLEYHPPGAHSRPTEAFRLTIAPR